MNLAALIGEVISEVAEAGGAVTFRLAVVGAGAEAGTSLTVRVTGAQAAACRRFLVPGHRVAVEGRVVPGAHPADVAAERVQFLTTRAQSEALRNSLRPRAA